MSAPKSNDPYRKKCELCGIRTNILFETPAWVVVLNIDQNYLGRFLVISKRHAESLSALTAEEWDDLHHVVKKSEATLRNAFPEINVFNWGCLMNHAFRGKPYNPHVHWHVKPRYDSPITFAGTTWTDPEFGSHYNPKSTNLVSNELLQKILEHIRSQA